MSLPPVGAKPTGEDKQVPQGSVAKKASWGSFCVTCITAAVDGTAAVVKATAAVIRDFCGPKAVNTDEKETPKASNQRIYTLHQDPAAESTTKVAAESPAFSIGIKDVKKFEDAMKIAEGSGAAISMRIGEFDLTEDELLAVAKKAAARNPDDVLDFIDNYEFADPKHRAEIIQLCKEKMGG